MNCAADIASSELIEFDDVCGGRRFNFIARNLHLSIALEPTPRVDFKGRCVYVVDDDEDVRRSLHFLLTTRHANVTSFRNTSEFLEAQSGLLPSPLILDVRMPGEDGLQLLAELVERGAVWPAIFLTGHGDVAKAVQAIKLGATDFLEKPVVASELEDCLERAFALLDLRSVAEQNRTEASRLWVHLTERELEVLHHLCDGLSNKEVAFQLGISPRTVEMHRANALRQLRVKSLPEVMKLKIFANPVER